MTFKVNLQLISHKAVHICVNSHSALLSFVAVTVIPPECVTEHFILKLSVFTTPVRVRVVFHRPSLIDSSLI